LELMEKLEEYKKYKLAAEDLKSNVTDLSEVFYRKKEEIIIDEKIDLEDISIDAIKMILPHILKVKTSEETESKDDRLNKIVKGRIVSVEEKMVYIRGIIKEKEQVHFTNIIEDCDKNEVIATFLSILELIKAKEITVEQDIFFDDILIKRSSE
ncbi:MAG: segregation/condensation protein A, partial [Peptostreptococcaceae bacterium]|nr:segregation/condensation protein A [Peptostreptococcaceae bacterium]